MAQCHLTPRYSNSDERIHSVSVDAEKVVQREKIASAQAAVVVFLILLRGGPPGSLCHLDP
jgi:hypothetical protein